MWLLLVDVFEWIVELCWYVCEGVDFDEGLCVFVECCVLVFCGI